MLSSQTDLAALDAGDDDDQKATDSCLFFLSFLFLLSFSFLFFFIFFSFISGFLSLLSSLLCFFLLSAGPS